jgi:hypothetical protein
MWPMKKVIWWVTLTLLVCAFLLSTGYTINFHYINLEKVLQLQDDIFESPEEKWQGIDIQGSDLRIYAKDLETGHRVFALLSGISICSASAIAVFVSVSYFVERRRAHNQRIDADAQ